MGLDDTTAIKLSLKRLSGKSQTSNDKGVANEALPSNVVMSAQTVFGNSVPPTPTAVKYTITGGTVEYLRLSSSFIQGSDTSSGRHAFSLKLPDDYESNSSNPSAGTYPFINGQSIPITSGSLQIIPPSFGTSYEALAYNTGSGETQIPVLDARDWVVDYFAGIFFQQDPPGTGNNSSNPCYVDAYLYVGDYLLNSTGSGGSGAPVDAQYVVLSADASLTGERVFNPSTGISVSDGGAGGNYTVSINDGVVATLTGSQFSGNIGATGSIEATSFFSGSMFKAPVLSGSLTKLHDGTSYLVAGNNIQIVTGSSGGITITGTSTGDITSVVAGTGLTGGGASGDVTLNIDNSVVATLTGSQFSGNVGITGSLGATLGLSGSLTKLLDGTSYIRAGNNITVASSSNGAITITSTGGIGGSGAANRIATWSAASTLTSDSDFTWNGSLLDVQGDANINGTLVVNQSGRDKNFRVETLNKSSALVVDGEVDQVLLFSGSLSDAAGHGSSASDPDPRAFTDTNFFVSGSIDSRGTSRRGTSVFGGDVVLSGTLSINRAQAGVGSFVTVTSDGKVGIGSDTPAYKLSVGGNMDVGEYIYHKNDANTYIRFQNDDINIQAGGVDLIKMTESGANTQVLILSGGSASDPNPANFGDTSFFVSGSVGSIGTSSGGSSVFGGDVLSSGSLVVKSGISGSLTKLSDGTSYIKAGSGVTVTSASNGSITIASSGTAYTAGDGLDLSGTEFSVDLKSSGGLKIESTELTIDDSVVATISGSTFTGAVNFNSGMSGSLTKLTDGTSYLKAGTNITIASASNGAVTITSTGVAPGAGGSDTQVQFNDSDSLNGNANFTFDKATAVLSVTNLSGSLTKLTDGTSYLRAGNGISVVSASAGYITIDTAPTKVVYNVTGSHSSGSPLSVSGVNFVSNDFDFNKTDIYLNGTLMMSGSSNDYRLKGNAQDIIFNFELQADDILMIKLI